MSAIILRKLTKKSKLNFGTYRENTVEHLIGMRKQLDLISSYFKLSNITFVDEILDELGITEEFRIEKPSTNVELYQKFLAENYGKRYRNKTLLKMRVETKPLSKKMLASINHGH